MSYFENILQFQSLVTSDKLAVRFLARLRQHDHRTVFGKTLARIAQESSSDFPVSKFISKTCVKRNLKYFPIPDGEVWRLPLLRDLMETRNDNTLLPGFTPSEVHEMLKYVCTS